ncbi:SHOCT domain-containing protein [Desulfitobacterium sp.]|uniref:SHOCT domain-containing protein n=1 Tax=Desulfitobacterium sp. TaxID=49981 RepID=UPI002CF8ECCD|nr:SHOCT domain-containing protein [Desulfitobacterium sp.]HVJ48516.1 SHOCT domain-containing protein [Desulfitobacterium sp.]
MISNYAGNWGGYGGGCGLGYFSGYGGDFGRMGLLGIGVHAIFWILVILLILVLVHRYRKHNSGSFLGFNHNEALNILREKYARGEIDTEEYEQRRDTLLK